MLIEQIISEIYKNAKLKIDPEISSFFDEVYSLSSYELLKKIDKFTKGKNRLKQLINFYNLYNAYILHVSDFRIKGFSENEMTIFKRQHDVVNVNDLTNISLHQNELVYESFSLFKFTNIEIYLRKTFIEMLNELIQDEYQSTHNYKADKTSLNSDKSNFSFVNNFDTTDPEKVYEHFNLGLVGKKYLSKECLQDYLKCAFEERQMPENKFSFDKLEKQNIKRLFYDYYITMAGKPHGKQSEYVDLLANYFTGFESKSLYSNFNK